jgi:hypothetical protein
MAADLSAATSSQTSAGGSFNAAARGTTGIIDRVRDTATAQLTSQKDRATDGLGSISQAVRQSTHQLRDQKHDVLAHYVERAADQIDRFSQRMRDKNVDDLVRDIQQMARRRPAFFIGGAFAVGLIGARFFKSSSRTTYGRQDRDPSNAAHRTASAQSDFEADDTGITAATPGVAALSDIPSGHSHSSPNRSSRSVQAEGS